MQEGGVISLSRLANQQVALAVDARHAAVAVAQPDKDDRFDLLTKYIPTETLMLYVAAMAILPSIQTSLGIGAPVLYLAGTILTPVMLCLATLGKLKASGSDAPFRPQHWPLIAATLAFMAWGPSVPGLLTEKDDQILAGFFALTFSTLLALFDAVLGQGNKNSPTSG